MLYPGNIHTRPRFGVSMLSTSYLTYIQPTLNNAYPRLTISFQRLLIPAHV